MLGHALVALLVVAAPPGAVEVEARFAGTGEPAPRVTLFFSQDEEPGRGFATGDDGRLGESPPADAPGAIGVDGQAGRRVRMMAQDGRRWDTDLLKSVATNPANFARNQALEALLKPVPTLWRVREGRARLVVECPPVGQVDVAVLAPDGAAAANLPVWVFPAEMPSEPHGGGGVRFEGKTDADGRFLIGWFEGMRRLRVVVPGVGFGATGTFEVVRGRLARPALPPLARFASVEGTLDPKLIGAGMAVALAPNSWTPRTWDRAEAACDKGGRFVLADVVPGNHRLILTRDRTPVPIAPLDVKAVAGGRVEGLVLRPPAPPGPKEHGPDAALPRIRGGGAEKKEARWVEGRALDEAGQPIAGASVLARTAYHGGMRMYEDLRETTTDARGHYRVMGPVWEHMDPLALVVIAGDRPPAVAYAPAPTAEDEAGKSPPRDITLAAKGGDLKVTVLKGGKPLAGASVGLQPDGVASLTQWARANGGGNKIDAHFHPSAISGADGVARFRGLFPGNYQIVANDRPDPLNPQDLANGTAEGVSVSGGQEVETTLAVHPRPCTARLLVFRPDGTPVRSQNVSFSFGLGQAGSSTSLMLDDKGVGTYSFSGPGLWVVDVRFRDTELKSFPIYQEPYDQITAVLAITPALAVGEPLALRAVRRDRGLLRVRLLDVEGKPARGTLIVGNAYGSTIDYAGTTDERGEVRFADLPSGSYEVRGSIDGETPAFDPGGAGTYPEDDAPLEHGVLVEGTTAKVAAGAEGFAELRARRAGYIRFTIRPPEGHEAKEYHVSYDTDRPGLLTQWRGDPETRRYTAGPIPSGPHTLTIHRAVPAGSWPKVGTRAVEVPEGGSVRVELAPVEGKKEGPSDRKPAAVSLGMGGLRVREAEPIGAGGTVLLPDGVTPAFGARSLLFAPEYEAPTAAGVSDGAGVLTWRGRWISNGDGAVEAGRVARPTAVVWLPGRCGATIVEVVPGKPPRVVLPPPIDAIGRVTVGGRPLDGRNARVRIVAAHQGRGALDAALGQAVAAEADGRFALRGLTPGRYRVQAAFDGIWLSRSVELLAVAGEETATLALDIFEPGRPVVVEVADGRGHPVADRALTLARPEGPLAAPWPKSLRTDGAGSVTLSGLEAGTHSIVIDGEDAPRKLRVPEARGAVSRPEVVRFILGPSP